MPRSRFLQQCCPLLLARILVERLLAYPRWGGAKIAGSYCASRTCSFTSQTIAGSPTDVLKDFSDFSWARFCPAKKPKIAKTIPKRAAKIMFRFCAALSFVSSSGVRPEGVDCSFVLFSGVFTRVVYCKPLVRTARASDTRIGEAWAGVAFSWNWNPHTLWKFHRDTPCG